MKLGDIGLIAATELDYAREAIRIRDYDVSSAHALLSIAASLYRLQAIPARLPFDPLDPRPAGTRYAPPGDPWGVDRDTDPPDPLDRFGVDPPESEAERYVRERAEDRD